MLLFYYQQGIIHMPHPVGASQLTLGKVGNLYCHLLVEETETQRGEVTHPRSLARSR